MSSRSKIVYVISMVDNSLPFFWFFKELKETGNDFDVIFLHPKPPALLARLKDENMACHFLKYSSKLDIPDHLTGRYNRMRQGVDKLVIFYSMWKINVMISRMMPGMNNPFDSCQSCSSEP